MKPLGRSKTPLTAQQIIIVNDYLYSELSYKEVAEKYNVPASTIMYWVKKYRKQQQQGDDKP